MRIILDATALAALIKDNEEAKIEITNAAIAEFAKRHLKPIANSPVITKLKSDLEKANSDLIKSIIGGPDRFGDYKLNSTLQSHLKAAVAEAVSTAIRGMVTDAIDTALASGEWTKDKIDARVNKRLDRLVEERIASRVDEQVKAKLDAIIKGINP